MELASMRFQIRSSARLALVVGVALCASPSAFGQSEQPPASPAQPVPVQPVPAQPASPQLPAAPNVRRLSIDDAVKLALEQNLNVQVERLNPELQALAITQARTSWTPTLTTGFTGRTQDSPPSSFLSGATEGKITNKNVSGNVGIEHLLPFGTYYQVSYDSSRTTTNNAFSSFNPELGANLDFTVIQPLLRDFKIDTARFNLYVARKNKEISDVGLQQTIAATIRSVKNAYWDYKYSLASLDVARQSLDLARESLRDTRSRVEIGTLAPIDIVEAESEVAQREEAVITAEAAIGQTEDQLRSLIYDPAKNDLWNLRLEPADPVPTQVQGVDIDAAVRRALRERTDLVQGRKTLERTGISERYYRNQSKPALTARVDYNATGIGGTELVRGGDTFPPPVIATANRPYSELLRDVFGSAFPTWTFSLNMSYPIGTSSAKAALAQTRLAERQTQVNLRSLELQVVTQVRDAARQLMANSKRIDATRAARVLAERRLEAEEKKFAAGMSTSFLVFQAQRDLSLARNTELRATLDYAQSQVNFDTVQVAPVSGGSSFTPTGPSSTTTTPTNTNNTSSNAVQ
jgi:outer membrane protein